MNKRKLSTFVWLILVSSLLMAAIPMPNQGVFAKSELVSLTIQNNSNDYVTLRLEGIEFYYLTVMPGQTSVFTPKRGEYEYKFYSCGVFVTGTLDLTKQQTIVVPACGSKALKADYNTKIDAGKWIKLVKVYFENTTNHNLVLILEGPGEFVFFIRKGETKTYTIPKGDYEIVQYGCDFIKEINYYAFAHKEKELTCPSW